MIKSMFKAIVFAVFIAAPLIGFGQTDLIEYPNGEVYSGEILNGQPNGRGRMAYPWGAIYEGNWKEGRKNGGGKQAHADGRVYIGEWENGSYLSDTLVRDQDDRLVREAQREERAAAERARQKEAALLAKEDDSIRDGDFANAESCVENVFGSTKKDYISFLEGAKIRPNGGLHWAEAYLEDFSEDTLTVRNDFGLILLDITDSPKWFNESDASIGSLLAVIGFYRTNVESVLTSGASAQLPRLQAKCIQIIRF